MMERRTSPRTRTVPTPKSPGCVPPEEHVLAGAPRHDWMTLSLEGFQYVCFKDRNSLFRSAVMFSIVLFVACATFFVDRQRLHRVFWDTPLGVHVEPKNDSRHGVNLNRRSTTRGWARASGPCAGGFLRRPCQRVAAGESRNQGFPYSKRLVPAMQHGCRWRNQRFQRWG